jgi:hypothetical protein
MMEGALAALLPSLLSELEGKPGIWRGTRGETPVYLLCDEEHNRMRVMSPVGEMRELDAEFLSLLLQANFDRALDARYALRGRELWSVFVHPLSTVASDDLGLIIDQVVALVKNTGSTYASADLVFGGDCEEETVDMIDEYEMEVEEEEEEDGNAG